VGTLRLLESTSAERHQGEVYSCTYTPDGAFVLSAGWDGTLRLWDAATGEARVTLPASPKPLSSCACTPDGQQWLSGSMEGLLSHWDGVSHTLLNSFVAHTRPISAITFAPDGQTLATTSWDRLVTVRKVGKEREGRTVGSHADIVAGCRFTVDGKQVISWSYDRTIGIWDVALGRAVGTLAGHTDRVVCGATSPDGRLLLSGGRDGTVRLWDLEQLSELATVNLGSEVRACFYLLDGESVVAADAGGRLFLMSVPTFEVQAQVLTPFRVMCGELSPSGEQLALGAEDGAVHLAALEGFESAALVVNATQSLKPAAGGLLDRILGSTRMQWTFNYTCPACKQSVESPALPSAPVPCPRCRRSLRVNARVPALQGS
jgi:WD40 repeat protein